MRAAAFGLAGALALVAGNDPAELIVTFTESAPTDLFRIANHSPCDVVLRALTIDLAGSRGDLIFDTEAGGAGRQAWAPLQLADGAVSAVTAVGDGDRALTLTFRGLRRGDAATVGIDLDDRLAPSPLGQTRIADAEIEGALIRADLLDAAGTTRSVSARFGPDGRARIAAAECAVS